MERASRVARDTQRQQPAIDLYRAGSTAQAEYAVMMRAVVADGLVRPWSLVHHEEKTSPGPRPTLGLALTLTLVLALILSLTIALARPEFQPYPNFSPTRISALP